MPAAFAFSAMTRPTVVAASTLPPFPSSPRTSLATVEAAARTLPPPGAMT